METLFYRAMKLARSNSSLVANGQTFLKKLLRVHLKTATRWKKKEKSKTPNAKLLALITNVFLCSASSNLSKEEVLSIASVISATVHSWSYHHLSLY